MLVNAKMRPETELYVPVKEFFEASGFAVRGEVDDCDLVAIQGDQVVVVELKRTFNLALVLQATDRLRLTELVYVAVEAPGKRVSVARWRAIQHLCRRLGVGLITVRFTRRSPVVELVCDLDQTAPKRSPRVLHRLLKEFRGRTQDHNQGGSNGRPRVTAYREDALRIAVYLEESGPSSPKSIKHVTGCERAATILQADAYGWFERVERGVYRITPQGVQGLITYAHVLPLL